MLSKTVTLHIHQVAPSVFPMPSASCAPAWLWLAPGSARVLPPPPAGLGRHMQGLQSPLHSMSRMSERGWESAQHILFDLSSCIIIVQYSLV